MNHLIISREYPPAPYAGGGIGTYVDHISRLLAAHGETVHVIAQLWPGAPRVRETRGSGRLIVHRVPLDEPLALAGDQAPSQQAILNAFHDSPLPNQAFLWQAALLAESLIETAAIDVIEAQEYEAPVYFLLLRRALGLASARPVPIIVHLHTPTEFVFKQNEWDQGRPDYLPQKRLEDYTIRAADALLCPSRFLAQIAERHYQLESGSIQVIPYPAGETAVVPRSSDTWATGTICYVGRLEPRKGVSEWIEAAVAVASDDPALRFVFIGGDTSYSGNGDRSMREILLARIPDTLRARFTFVDNVPREQLVAHLARSRIAVVPSRWENFPNTCIEAMLSGLPVLATPTGGMVEMIEDGKSGWIARGPDSKSIETAFRRAISTPPAVLEHMGAAAAAAIRALCDNDETIRKHLAFRRLVAGRGSERSARLVAPSTRTAQRSAWIGGRASRSRSPSGVAVVVRSRRLNVAPGCIESLAAQNVPPVQVVLLVPPDSTVRAPLPGSDSRCAWQIVRHSDIGSAAAGNEALGLIGSDVRAVAFLDDEWIVAPEYIGVMDTIFRDCSDVGVVSPWHRENGGIRTTLPPAFPYQWVWNDIGPCAAFRLTAVEEAEAMRTPLADGYAMWDLCNAILARGWRVAPFPAILASRAESTLPALAAAGRPLVSYESILSRFPELFAPDAVEVAVLQQVAGHRLRPQAAPATDRTMTPLEILRASPKQWRSLIGRAVTEPGHVVQWLGWHGRRALGSSSLHNLVAAARAALRRRPS